MTTEPMTTKPATGPTTDPVEEIWTFGGSRVHVNGGRVHAWIPDDIDDAGELLFPARGSYVTGSLYWVQVTRHGDGRVTKHGESVYVGRHGDDAVRARLDVAHRAAETRLRLAALQRNDKRHAALDEAIQPLCEIIRSASTVDRDAILVYVLRRLSRAW
jgi:hypothetical protein